MATPTVPPIPTATTDTVLLQAKRSFAGIFPDVVLEERHEDELEISSHPVDKNTPISDHAFKRQAEVTMICAWGNSLGNAKDTDKRIDDKYTLLLSLQDTLEIFTVFTGKRTYKNMMLKTLTVHTTKETEYSLIVEARFLEVLRVSSYSITSAVTYIGSSDQQAKPQNTAAPVNTGTVQPAPVSNIPGK